MTRKRHGQTPRPFNQVIAHLRDTTQTFPPIDLYHFSGLEGTDLAALERAWPEVAVERRRAVLEDLHELGENNFEVNFETIFRMALEDDDAEARATAIIGLWEAEALDLVAPFIQILHTDLAPTVRAAAASALGRYIYLGELEDIPAPLWHRVEEALLEAANSPDDLEVRRRALEALGYSSRPEVPALIRAAYHASDELLRVSALFAMGRSGLAEPWGQFVLTELDNDTPTIRFEAVRAAGELHLADAVSVLEHLLDDTEDTQIYQASIWSLSEIGGTQARRRLERQLEQTTDEDEQEFLEEALENLDFTEEVEQFALLDFGEDDLDAFADDEDDDELDPNALN